MTELSPDLSDQPTYTSARQKSNLIMTALRDISTLIGEPQSQSVRLESGVVLQPGLGLSSDAADLTSRANDIQQGIFRVLVLGEFKNGKSTLLNALLGSKTLPAKVTPATAIITVLVYGQGREVGIYESQAEKPRMISWEAFVDEFKLTRTDIETLDKTGYLDRFQNIDFAQVECQHPFCANGVRLIDSPGLGEQASRTRVTTNFLKQAHAVIFVLNATRILSEEEKKFIQQRLGSGRLNQVFFVVNRVNQIDAEDLADIKSWVQAVLKPHFLDADGQFDQEFYHRRVFYLNALGALEARLENPVDETALEASGLPALEHELEHFLTSDEKFRAVVETTMQYLTGVVSEATRRLAEQKASLDQPLAELEKHRDEAETRLKALETKKEEIERAVLLFASVIKNRVYGSLRDYINEMHRTWPEDSHTLIRMDEVLSLLDVVQSLVSKEAEARIAAGLEKEVKKYLRLKLGDWAEQIPEIIKEDTTKMAAELKNQLEDFQLGLDEIGNLFRGGPAAEFSGADGNRGERLAQLALGFGDFGQLSQAGLQTGDWTALIGNMLQQVLMVVIIFGLFGGPLAWIILLVVEGWFLLLQREKFKERLLEKVGDRLHEELLKELPAKQGKIYQAIEKRFEQFARHVTRTLQGQIDEKRREIERIVRQKKDTSFSIEQEKGRLHEVGLTVMELFDRICQVAYGRKLSRDELERLASGKSIQV